MKITVITVAFNSAKTIIDTLNSVASQDYNNIEHLIIDGGSTDGTIELVCNHSNQAIRLISEPDDGIYSAMNKGFLLAQGDIVGFLNSDDFFSNSNSVSQIVNSFNDQFVEACFSDLIYVSYDKNKILRYWQSSSFKLNNFSLGWAPPHPTFYVRRDIVSKFGLFNINYKLAADFDFMLRYLECGRINSVYIPKCLVHMRLGGATNKNLRNILIQNLEILSSLKYNKINYSLIKFFLFKYFNRIFQFFLAYKK